jgi:hypothetical protein
MEGEAGEAEEEDEATRRGVQQNGRASETRTG